MGTLGRIPAVSLDGRTESRRERTAGTDLSVRSKDTNITTGAEAAPVVPDHQMPQCDPHHVPTPPLTFGLLDALLCDITLSPQDEVAMTLLSTKACYLLGLSPPAKDASPSLPSSDSQYQQSPRPRRTPPPKKKRSTCLLRLSGAQPKAHCHLIPSSHVGDPKLFFPHLLDSQNANH